MLEEQERVGYFVTDTGLDQGVLQLHRLAVGDAAEIADDHVLSARRRGPAAVVVRKRPRAGEDRRALAGPAPPSRPPSTLRPASGGRGWYWRCPRAWLRAAMPARPRVSDRWRSDR